MSATVALLLSAIQLLTLVVSTPNLPQPIRETALTVAFQAINEANRQQGLPEVDATLYTQYTQTPVAGNTQTSTIATTTPVSMPESKAQLRVVIDERFEHGGYRDPANGVPFGEYFYKVSLLDEQGKNVNGVEVILEAPDNVNGKKMVKKIDTISTTGAVDYYHTFSYIPSTAGTKTLVFTGGGLTTEIVLNVQ